MKVLVVGAGLIGEERIKALVKIGSNTGNSVEISNILDPDSKRLSQIVKKYSIKSSLTDLNLAFEDRPEWVFISTPHYCVKEIILKAFQMGCNVLVEKPLGRNLDEANEIVSAKPHGIKLMVGFNYRFYSGISRVISDANAGIFGEIISVNMILGHGNSPGMEKSWKLDPVKCGGGCLIDPGIHLLDLVGLLSTGQIEEVKGSKWAGFWNTGIEEEAHLIMTNSNKTIFNIQTSLNRWRSQFYLEINGTNGYGRVEGRGKSYGTQSYSTGKRWGWQSGVPQPESEILEISNDSAEDSFFKETVKLLGIESKFPDIEIGKLNPCTHEEALETMKLLDLSRLNLGLPILI